MNNNLLEVTEHLGEGYKPLVDYGAWRVAVLNFDDELLPERLDRMQCHNETDEVFVLLSGCCILFLGTGTDTVSGIQAVNMEPFKAYNVKRGAWHTHTLSRDARVLIIENSDISFANSPYISLTSAQTDEIVTLTKKLWI